MNWFQNTGTVQFQGNAEAKNRLDVVVTPLLERAVLGEAFASAPEPAVQGSGRRIFVVHGHDEGARDQLELALRRLRLEPFILINTTGEGKTIIEALEGTIGRDYSSDFGIALFTPDDMGYAVKAGVEMIEPRARQNVILETGMLLASLTRERMAIIVKGHVEIPSDLQGIIRLSYNHHIREVLRKLCTRLQEAGILVDQRHISEALS